MTNEQRKKIFEYMDWCKENCCSSKDCYCSDHPLDGNDINAVMDKMIDKKDWEDFFYFAYKIAYKGSPKLLMHGAVLHMMQPQWFFDLMVRALDNEVIGK
jgi:hypothetical protein